MYTRKGRWAKMAPISRVEVPRTISDLREITNLVPLVAGYQMRGVRQILLRACEEHPDAVQDVLSCFGWHGINHSHVELEGRANSLSAAQAGVRAGEMVGNP